MRVNGTVVAQYDPLRRLLDVLRDDLGLTGAKEGCGVGECGSCTVLVNGDPVCSCLMLAGQVEDQEVLTVEGLSNGPLSELQQAAVENGAVQCGYCIPGMVMSASAHLAEGDVVTAETARRALSGNLCRCTGYQAFVEAVVGVAGRAQ